MLLLLLLVDLSVFGECNWIGERFIECRVLFTLIGVVLVGMGEMGRDREHSWLDTSKFLKLSVRLGLCLSACVCLRF